MSTLLQVGLSNVAVASLLAIVALAVGRLCKRPALAHGLWLLVLLKLITPPLIVVPVSLAAVLDATGLPSPAKDARKSSFSHKNEGLRQIEFVQHTGPENSAAQNDFEPGDLTEPDRQTRAERTASAEPEPKAKQQETSERSLERANQTTAIPKSAQPTERQSSPAGSTLHFNQIDWAFILGIIWIGGSIGWFALALIRVLRFARLLHYAEIAPTDLQREATALAQRLGRKRPPLVWLAPGAVSPMLWALASRPRLLLPKELLPRINSEQRLTLLAHELAHYSRADHWVRYLEIIVLGLYWWCPLAWWARRELNQAEEECCDAWVVWALPNSSRAYATALVETLDFLAHTRLALPPAASGLGQIRSIRRRLTMIMRGTTPRTLSRTGLLALFGVGLLLLPLLPGWAQDRKGRDDRNRESTEKQERLDRLHAHLEELHKDFERQRREFEQQVAKIRDEMARLGFRRPNRDPQPPNFRRPDDPDRSEIRRPPNAPQNPNPFRDESRPPRGQRPPDGDGHGHQHGPGDLQHRLLQLERKVDMILRHLERRGAGPRAQPPRARRNPPGVGGDPSAGPDAGTGFPPGGAGSGRFPRSAGEGGDPGGLLPGRRQPSGGVAPGSLPRRAGLPGGNPGVGGLPGGGPGEGGFPGGAPENPLRP